MHQSRKEAKGRIDNQRRAAHKNLPVTLPGVARENRRIRTKHCFVCIPKQPPERGALSRWIVRCVADKRPAHRIWEEGRTRSVLDTNLEMDVEEGDVDRDTREAGPGTLEYRQRLA